MRREIFTSLHIDKNYGIKLRRSKASRHFRRLASGLLNRSLDRNNLSIARRSSQKQRLTPSPTNAAWVRDAISSASDPGLSPGKISPFAQGRHLASVVTESAKRTLNQPLEQYVEWHKRRRALL
jgi:hypothetical protein